MVKLVRIVGFVLLSLLLLSACSPTEFFLTRTYNWQPTPTPRDLSGAVVSTLLTTQLAQLAGETPTVTVDESETTVLVVEFAGGGDELVMQTFSSIGGFLEVNETTVETVSVTAGGNTVEADTTLISEWFNRNVTDEEFAAALNS